MIVTTGEKKKKKKNIYCYGFLHRKRENKYFSGMLASSNIYILPSFCLHPISLRMPKLSTLLIVTFPAYLKFCFLILTRLTHNPSSYPLNALSKQLTQGSAISLACGLASQPLVIIFYSLISHPHISQIPCMFLLAYLALLFFLHFH